MKEDNETAKSKNNVKKLTDKLKSQQSSLKKLKKLTNKYKDDDDTTSSVKKTLNKKAPKGATKEMKKAL